MHVYINTIGCMRSSSAYVAKGMTTTNKSVTNHKLRHSFFSDFHAIWMIYTQIYGIMCAYCVHMRICAPLYRLLQRINDSESAKIDLHQSSLFRSFLLWTRTSSSLPPSLSLFLYLVFVWIFFSSLSFIYSENYMLWLKLVKRFPLNFFSSLHRVSFYTNPFRLRLNYKFSYSLQMKCDAQFFSPIISYCTFGSKIIVAKRRRTTKKNWKL